VTSAARPKPADFKLGDADFERLRDYFYKRTGVQFADSKHYFLEKRIATLLEDSGHEDFATWFGEVRFGKDKQLEQTLIGRLTVHETYFMREDYQLDCLIESVLPEVLDDTGESHTVRILSLPCSTGDEPYSIAISLLERWPEIDRVDVEISGLDIAAESVAAARAGVYGERALHRLSPALVQRYFGPQRDGKRQISADLREAVSFRVGNVCDTSEMRSFRGFDVIFCRNLLIYFDELSCRRAAENLFGMLRPGGFLFLGHSESMSRISSIFEPVRFESATVYQRPFEEVR
jgi:chemotaxis protein methyltransferase CheR